MQSLQTRAGFGMLLLHIMQHSTNMVARIAAAIAFKNHVRSFWNKVRRPAPGGAPRPRGPAPTSGTGSVAGRPCLDQEKAVAEVPEGDPLGDESREAIRRNIVDLMLLAPAQVQRQVGEAVTIIADYDFPHKWDYLLQVRPRGKLPWRAPACGSETQAPAHCGRPCALPRTAGPAEAAGAAGRRGARERHSGHGAFHLQAVRTRRRLASYRSTRVDQRGNAPRVGWHRAGTATR